MEEHSSEDQTAQERNRLALSSLPTFDDDTPSPEQDANVADDATVVIVTHQAPDNAEPETAEPATAEPDPALGETALMNTSAESGETVMLSPQETHVEAGVADNTEPASPAAEDGVAQPDEEDDGKDEALQSLDAPVELDPSEAQPQEAPEPTQTISEGVRTYGAHFAGGVPVEEGGKGKRVAKRILVALVAIAAVLGVVYVAGGLYFSSHFLPNTTVNGEDVSGMSVDDLKSYITSIGDNYTSHITGDGIDLTIRGPEVDFLYDGEAYGDDAASQIDNWSWPTEINESRDYKVEAGLAFDEQKLEALVGAAVDAANNGASQPTNATMSYDEEQAKFIVVPDALGTAINKEAVLPIVNEGIGTMQAEITLTEEQLVQPTVTQDDEQLNETVNKVNAMLDTSVQLRIADTDALAIDRAQLASWISMDGEGNVNINQDEIKTWAQGALSEQFDTKGTKRSFTRADGKQIEVEGGSADYDYGWCLDGEALADVVTNNLRAYNTDPIDVPMKSTAASWNPGGKDWPNRYIDADLSEQHARMYDNDNNVIWESDFVSGNPIYGGGTDTGVFFIYMKSSPMELVGLDYDHDGEPDYRSWVTYWMPFDGGEGLHDMKTRYSFGGDIYTYNGSHGCLNLPYDAAEQLWNLTEVGDVVVVHW